MSLKIRTRKEYHLICDRCGEESIRCWSEEGTRLESASIGWTQISKWNGFEYANYDLCDDCTEILEGEWMEHHALA
jgi:hypothetical protein